MNQYKIEYQDALDGLSEDSLKYNKSLIELKDFREDEVDLFDAITKENTDTLQELVDKVTPKKPRCYWDNDNDLYKYDCPNCYKQLAKHGEFTKISKIKKVNFCSNCGQAIDWSEDKPRI